MILTLLYLEAISVVLSDEFPSAITISSTQEFTESRQRLILFSSLKVAMATEIVVLFMFIINFKGWLMIWKVNDIGWGDRNFFI